MALDRTAAAPAVAVVAPAPPEAGEMEGRVGGGGGDIKLVGVGAPPPEGSPGGACIDQIEVGEKEAAVTVVTGSSGWAGTDPTSEHSLSEPYMLSPLDVPVSVSSVPTWMKMAVHGRAWGHHEGEQRDP